QQVAFADSPGPESPRGVAVIDRQGRKRTVAQGFEVARLAWKPDGREIIFSGKQGNQYAICTTTLEGRLRVVFQSPDHMILHDRAPDGRLLVEREITRVGILAMAPGERQERDLSWFDSSRVAELTRDGTQLLFEEWSELTGYASATYIRKTDG